jgi:oxygen-independent coproporphyrinogen III oxidase
MHLYIHVPFCRQACHYCDFHFSTQLGLQPRMVEALCHEIALRHDYLPRSPIQTIYLGGGTPSLLTEAELERILDQVHRYFGVDSTPEITIEANPDDLSTPKLHQLIRAGINRLSIGIQSFNDQHLRYLHRVHDSLDALRCVREAQELGLTNISIDLIYAIPADSHAIWQADLQQAVSLRVPHISAYCLTIEPKTVFGKWLSKKQIPPIDEGFAAEQFEQLTSTLALNQYEQYEISNFSLSGCQSRHNSAYWLQKPYLGIGPSAHSYNGGSRQHNIAHNLRYVETIQQGLIPAEIELLSPQDKVNDYLLTSLRTSWGCDLPTLHGIGNEAPLEWQRHWLALEQTLLPQWVAQGWLSITPQTLVLTQAGKLFADRIASEMFWE